MSIEAMKQALESLSYVMSHGVAVRQAKDILTAAIEQAERKEWQGLTDEEAFEAFGFNLWPESFLAKATQEMRDTNEEAKKEVLSKVRSIEAKLKEKNHD